MNGHQIFLALEAFSIVGVGFALLKGGSPERLAAAVFVVNLLLGFAAQKLLSDPQGVFRLVNDGLAAVALLAITVRYATPWMGGVMLFYAGQFALHSYYLVTDTPPGYVYGVINNINWSGSIWCLIIGTAIAWRQRSHLARKAALEAAP